MARCRYTCFTLILLSSVFLAFALCRTACDFELNDNFDVSVDCSHLGLPRIPSGIPDNVTILRLQNNSIPTVGEWDLKGLSVLSNLDLSENLISYIHFDAFRGLVNIWELDLSRNRLTTIPNGVFDDLTQLYTLTLSHNRLTGFNLSLTLTHRNMIALNLANNRISRIDIDPDANLTGLHGQIGLEHLDLSNNDLHRLPKDIFYALMLQNVNLSGNAWSCDCHLKWLAKWTKDHYGTTLSLSSEPKCGDREGPNFGRLIRHLDFSSFVCRPMTLPHSSIVLIPEGTSLLLACPVFADPLSDIIWRMNGSIIGVNKLYGSSQYIVTQSLSLVLHPTDPYENIVTCQVENTGGIELVSMVVRVVKANDSEAASNIIPQLSVLAVDLTMVVAITIACISGLVTVLMLLIIFHYNLTRFRKQRKLKKNYQTYRPPHSRRYGPSSCYALIRQGQTGPSSADDVGHQRDSDNPEYSHQLQPSTPRASVSNDTSVLYEDYDSSGYLILSGD